MIQAMNNIYPIVTEPLNTEQAMALENKMGMFSAYILVRWQELIYCGTWENLKENLLNRLFISNKLTNMQIAMEGTFDEQLIFKVTGVLE